MKSEIDLKIARHEFPVFPVVAVTVGENIIAIGLVHVFSFTPLMVGIGVHPKRYSYGLLEKIKDYGVNIPTKELVEKVNLCGTVSGKNVNKFEKAGLAPMLTPKPIPAVVHLNFLIPVFIFLISLLFFSIPSLLSPICSVIPLCPKSLFPLKAGWIS